MRKITNFCDYFIILNGTSSRHLHSISEGIEEDLFKDRIKPLNSGQPNGEAGWVLLDFLSVIVHIFSKPMRQFYSLERLWQDAPLVKIPKKIK